MKGQRIQEGSRIVFSEVLTLSGVVRLFNNLFWYQPYIPYACGMDSAGLRNTFRTHTECIPHPMRNIWTVYHRIPEYVDTPSPLFLKM